MPGGPGVRMDGAVTTGNVVSRYYDSLLAKVICTAPSWPAAVQKMQRALNEFQVRSWVGWVVVRHLECTIFSDKWLGLMHGTAIQTPRFCPHRCAASRPTLRSLRT